MREEDGGKAARRAAKVGRCGGIGTCHRRANWKKWKKFALDDKSEFAVCIVSICSVFHDFSLQFAYVLERLFMRCSAVEGTRRGREEEESDWLEEGEVRGGEGGRGQFRAITFWRV